MMRRRLREYPTARPGYVVIVQKDTTTGEYRVAYREQNSGYTDENSAYYTTDLEDAEKTAQAMARQ
jgi:hypothetical protein